jgi:hypothetical protein
MASARIAFAMRACATAGDAPAAPWRASGAMAAVEEACALMEKAYLRRWIAWQASESM